MSQLNSASAAFSSTKLNFNQFIKFLHSNQIKEIKGLLSQNSHMVNQMYDGRTILSIAAERGYDELIQLLVDQHRAQVNNHNKNGVTPLISAIMHGHFSTVVVLCRRGADVNAIIWQNMFCSIDFAIINGHYDISIYLFGLIADKTLRKPEQYSEIAKKFHLRYVNYDMFIKGLRDNVDVRAMGNLYFTKSKGQEQLLEKNCWTMFMDFLHWRWKTKQNIVKGQAKKQEEKVNQFQNEPVLEIRETITAKQEKNSTNHEEIALASSRPLQEKESN